MAGGLKRPAAAGPGLSGMPQLKRPRMPLNAGTSSSSAAAAGGAVPAAMQNTSQYSPASKGKEWVGSQKMKMRPPLVASYVLGS